MAKSRTRYNCNVCGGVSLKWTGQCPDCNSWNTLEEVLVEANSGNRSAHLQGAVMAPPKISRLDAVAATREVRTATGIGELDRVLGGGLVHGSVTLIGGDPGIGKSTLLIQTLSAMADCAAGSTLYISGEESADQIGLRARRLGLDLAKLSVLTENNLERILPLIPEVQPRVIVFDSIQTAYTDLLQSAPGSVGQVRECAAQLVQLAKQSGISVFLVGHVTKDGAIAGPRVLEHMVDTVLYFEGDPGSRHRVIRSIKNRFGAVNELGVFAMTDKGLREVANPSAIFLSRHDSQVPGSVITVTREGTRPLLVEIQALVDSTALANPRRVTVGLEQNRLAMLLAVLHRHAGVFSGDQDIFINAVGGVRITETAADLPVLLAVLSSLRNIPLPEGLVTFGEIGLSGEVRPVQNGPERLNEASKHGFRIAIVPQGNSPAKGIPGMEIIPVTRLTKVLEQLFK